MERLSCAAIVPTFNRARYIREAIDSLLNQTRKPDRIIVVNDGSTDETISILEAYTGKIEVISKPNGGKSSAINAAIATVDEDCVWVFDDDDVALPDALERHLHALKSDPEAGFTYSPILVGQDGANGRIAVVHDTGVPDVKPEEFLIRLMEHCFIHGQPAIVARTEALRQIGLFDERLVRSQDYDIFVRLAAHCRPARVAEPTFIQRRHTGQRGSLAERSGGEDPFIAWSRYNRLLITKQLQTLALHDYMPASSAYSVRTAQIQRFVIAVRHGILDWALPDLDAIAAVTRDLSATERQMLMRALTHFTALREVGTDACRRLARLCRGRVGRQIRVAMAKGLIYEILTAPRQKRWDLARTLGPRIVALVGFAGAVEMFRERIRPTRVA